MASLSEHHKVLTDGVGKCSKPMWDGMGGPNGFCDEPAYGPQNPILRDVYCAGLACQRHGGPPPPRFVNGARVTNRERLTLRANLAAFMAAAPPRKRPEQPS